jgi:Spy/CpxP family protein refolding chaperone
VKRAMTALALMVFVGLVVAQTQPAQPAPMAGMPGMGMGRGMGMAKADIPDLTEAQRSQMDNLMTSHLREMMPLQMNLRLKEIELDALWRADKLDAKKITGAVKEINEIRGQIELARVNHQLAVAGILTPEQRKAFAPGRGHGRRGMGRGMGRGMMGGMGPGMMGGGMGCGMMGDDTPGPGGCPMGQGNCPDCHSQ